MEMHTYSFCLNVVRGSPMEFARMNQGNLKVDEGGEYQLSKVGGGARGRELKNGSYSHTRPRY